MPPKYMSLEELFALWAEIQMKFIHMLHCVTYRADSDELIFKLHKVPKEIRDSMILRRYSSMPGVWVGFYKPRRLKGASFTPKPREKYYTVYITVRFPGLTVTTRPRFPVSYDSHKGRDISAEGFDTWLTEVKKRSDESSTL